LSKSRSPKRTGHESQSGDDIPIAQRDRFTPAVTTMTSLRRQRHYLARVTFFVGGILMASLLAMFLLYFSPNPIVQQSAGNRVTTVETDALLGHLPYEEAPVNEMTLIGGGLKLRSAAAESFQSMKAAAKLAGVNITTISAFRSIAEQQHLFFGVKAQRAQITTKRAEVSAPPRYSEHHTGYALDLGDGQAPGTNLHQDFDQTAAYQWLRANVSRYSFELSFPQGNAQGVSYEPWHWRYVGNSDSLKTFAKARKMKPQAVPRQ
jgi:zinc D-Ala-D-Ala carboxypeptidase